MYVTDGTPGCTFPLFLRHSLDGAAIRWVTEVNDVMTAGRTTSGGWDNYLELTVEETRIVAKRVGSRQCVSPGRCDSKVLVYTLKCLRGTGDKYHVAHDHNG